MDVFLPSQGLITLPGTPAGRGGSGTVYRVGNLAVKVYHPHALNPQVTGWVKALTGLPSNPRFALPREEVLDRAGGAPVGFAMPWVSGVPLLCLLDDRAAAKLGVSFTPLERLSAARDLAALYDAAHRRLRVVIGDGNESNFLLARDPAGQIQVVCIDCDEHGGDYRDLKTGRTLTNRPNRGKVPYLPPALQGVDLRTADRTEYDDRFSLGALLFSILTGTQAFAVAAPPGSPPPGSVGRRIKDGLWPYAPQTPLPAGWQPAAAAVWRSLPHPVRELFKACFHDGHADPTSRPTPAAWQAALDAWVQAERSHPRYLSSPRGPPPPPARTQNLPSLASLIVRAIWSLLPARAAWWLARKTGFLPGLALQSPVAPLPPAPQTAKSLQRVGRQWVTALAVILAAALITAFVVSFWPPTEPPPPTRSPSPAPPPREGDHPRWKEAPKLWKDLLNEDP